MDKKSDLLIASLLYVIRRNWPAITDFWKKSFKFDLSEDVIAMSNFSMGVLTSFVVQSPNEMRLTILQSLRDTFRDEAAELEVILRKYEDAQKQPAKLAARYSVPPLEWEHEALAIVFVDSVEWRATQMIGGQEFYNLFLIGAIGGTIATTSIETKKAFLEVAG